jgi:hypothetical protein
LRGIRIYVEGGGDRKETKVAVRLGFGAFLGELRDAARQRTLTWDIITCGSRESAFDDFRTACRTHPDCFNVLLVDSEGPVSASPRRHLHARDGWALEVPEEHCHMMVQAMEEWIIADVEALRAFYGQGFQQSAIPGTKEVERIDKDRLLEAMTAASRQTQKGPYHKIHHGPKLLARVDPRVVRPKAPHCQRLFAAVQKVIDQAAPRAAR